MPPIALAVVDFSSGTVEVLPQEWWMSDGLGQKDIIRDVMRLPGWGELCGWGPTVGYVVLSSDGRRIQHRVR